MLERKKLNQSNKSNLQGVARQVKSFIKLEYLTLMTCRKGLARNLSPTAVDKVLLLSRSVICPLKFHGISSMEGVSLSYGEIEISCRF